MDIYEEIVALRRAGRRGSLATIISVRGSVPSFKTAKMLVRDDGSIVGTVGGGCVEAEVWQAAQEAMITERPTTLAFDLNQSPKYDSGLVCGGTLEIFVEPILPVSTLYIFGAGHISHSLAKAASTVGFEVTVVDDREMYASRERFADPVKLVVGDFEEVSASLTLNDFSYVVIVTRGHHDDMRILRWAVKQPARYIGMVGSKRKAIEIFRELTTEGTNAKLFDRVHSPIGLDIGAITPEEISVSIVAELISIRRNVERELPHMSWFSGGRGRAAVDGESKLDEAITDSPDEARTAS
jgi:xanthine dehydrogenase accessory factor